MDCQGFDEDLIPYLLGLVDDDARARLDEHVLGCPSCLRAFLESKGHVERHGGGLRPSPAAKERLRAALFADRVASTGRERGPVSSSTAARPIRARGPSTPARLLRSLARPVPLYQAFVAAAAVAAVVVLAPRLLALRAAEARPGVRVDTSRQVPASNDVY